MTLQVGVKAIIRNSSGQYLLIKRSEVMDGDSSPSWDIPGGRIDPGESLRAALEREINEEIGLTDIPEPKLIAAQDIFVKRKDLHVVRLTYVVNSDVGTIRLSDEHTDFRWVKPSDVDGMLVEPYLKEVLSSLI